MSYEGFYGIDMVPYGVYGNLQRLLEGRSRQVPEFQVLQFPPGIQNGERVDLLVDLVCNV